MNKPIFDFRITNLEGKRLPTNESELKDNKWVLNRLPGKNYQDTFADTLQLDATSADIKFCV